MLNVTFKINIGIIILTASVALRNGKSGIDGIMVIVLASSVVDREFEPQLGQTKDYTIGIGCFPAKHEALRRKSKDWFGIRVMCSSGATCLSVDYCFSELAL